MAFLSIDELLLINRWVQGLEDDESVFEIFHDWSSSKKGDVLLSVSQVAEQASPNDGDIDDAINGAPFKPTRSACVILRKGVSAETFYKLRSLNGRDAEDAFMIFLNLFKVADKRRRESEADCSHWWHQDLSDPQVIDAIRSEYAAGNL